MGNYLKSIRIKNGISQDEIAQILNISKTTYCHKETGKTEFNLKELKKMKEFFKLNNDEFCEVFFNE